MHDNQHLDLVRELLVMTNFYIQAAVQRPYEEAKFASGPTVRSGRL
jgi:hypothetical protein